jgi:CubicO group peptidase (beta-lactamase class C family)
MDIEGIFQSKLDDLLIEEMNITNTPGLALAVVDNGEVKLTRTYGTTNFEKNIPVDPDHIFNIASVTKSFICAGILLLQEENKLKVSDNINNYLPITIGFKDNPITIHHLMNHTSGIPNLADSLWSRNKEDFYDIPRIPKYPFSSWDDVIRFINGSQEFLSPPGTKFHYNNLAYGLLSKIITDVSGESFKHFLRKRIFDPLKMKNTYFFNELPDDAKLSLGYIDKPNSKHGEFLHIPYEDNRLSRSVDEAAGGLFSTVLDLSNYMIMQLNNGEFNDSIILSTESIEEMQKRQIEEKYPNSSFQGMYDQQKSGYGYGFAVDDDFHGHKLIQHSGSFIGASSWFAFIKSLNRGVVILCNHHPSPRMFAQAILLETINKDVHEHWNLLKLREFQKSLSGHYETYKGINKVKIFTKGSQLYLSDTSDKMLTPLIPLNHDHFSYDYYIVTETGGMNPVQFYKEKDSMWLHIERNKWKKIA